MHKTVLSISMMTLCVGIASWGQCAMIPLGAPKKDAAMGVTIRAQNVVEQAPPFPGMLEVLGIGYNFLDDSPAARYYSATASFKNPIDEVSFDVKRLNNSGWDNEFTMTAFDGAKRVGRMTIELNSLGDDTDITFHAKEITRLKWHGEGWAFHPYLIESLSVQFVASSPPQGGSTPVAGSASDVPEPALSPIMLLFACLLQRRRRNSESL